jgi:hypothetical protein
MMMIAQNRRENNPRIAPAGILSSGSMAMGKSTALVFDAIGPKRQMPGACEWIDAAATEG